MFPSFKKLLLAASIQLLVMVNASATMLSDKLDSFVSTKTGVCTDTDGIYGCQCVDLFHAYLQDVLGIPLNAQSAVSGNAYAIYQKVPNSGVTLTSATGEQVTFSKIANTATNFPQKGDVIFGNIGTNGHVAIVLSANANKFVSFDQNWGTGYGDAGLPAIQVTHNYTDMGVVGWLRPSSLTLTSNPPTVSLNTPADGQIYNASTTNIPLSWSASSDATNFRIIVSTNSIFSGFIDNGGSSACDSTCGTWTTTSSTFTFPTAKAGQTYYWKVRANNSNLGTASTWTAAKSFTISGVSVAISTKADGILNCVENLLSQYFPPHQVTQQWQQSSGDIAYVRSYSNNYQAVLNQNWYYNIGNGWNLFDSIDALKSNFCPAAW